MSELKIHLYTISWNEESMISHFLSYYSRFCEKIFIYDNFSTDNTKEIALSNPAVTFFQYDTNDEIRDDIYLKIKNECWKKSRGQADFVIVCDIDEFIYHQDLLEHLKKYKAEEISLIRPVGFNMIHDSKPSFNADLFTEVQFGVRSTDFDKVIVFNPNLIEEINYSSGAHKCVPIGIIKYAVNEFKLLHYKYLGLDNVINRYNLMSKRLSAFNKKNGLGFHYSFSRRKIRREFNNYDAKKINVFNS
jgi:hypothetical protein